MTFSRIDVDSRCIERVFCLPVLVPDESSCGEREDEQRNESQYHSGLASRRRSLPQRRHALGHQPTEPHARNVQDTLRNHEADVEEQISRWQKWKDEQSQ